MYRKKKQANFNRSFMFGVIAMGVVVIGVVGAFMVWSIPEKADGEVVEGVVSIPRTFTIGFAEQFVGDRVVLYANFQHLLYEGVVSLSQKEMEVKSPDPLEVLSVELPDRDETSHINITIAGGSIKLKRLNNEIVAEQLGLE